jgi:hypothetical protein
MHQFFILNKRTAAVDSQDAVTGKEHNENIEKNFMKTNIKFKNNGVRGAKI